jgi:hypothetical protein
MEVSGQIHTAATLPQRKLPPMPIGCEPDWLLLQGIKPRPTSS